ncbi:NO-inducible flavohemoprotein [Paenibacillus sp. OAS669]|uniref:NO-inducible flavohemoprotein n=1 Tax=Paenibacillus sp. OAS669 TaxID=2663821 RepID=UPI001789E6D5|nr:NO-inducible flavohemoprotein [Paenibacillus sp. OAS669]MBE1446347.1 nitric oxide dioxygenase [Paenibacillus sp. OAS669]
MLSEQTIQTIKSTVPVLEVHGTAITKRFYELLFTGHPELLNLFNHANQKKGRQQAALANAVYAAAAHIDQLETILPVVKQIAHKHRSLGVKAEHYPIVGETLLRAIKEVLGDAATDEIIAAWADAYGVIANVFIQTENEMYLQAEERVGGWKGFRRFIVERKVKESDTIASLYLVPEDQQGIADFEPGQYISVKLMIPGQSYTHIRQYSLSDMPGQPHYRISVKREEASEGKPEGIVSNYLHRGVTVGDVLEVSAPAGDFILRKEEKPAVLISGGVGLTPLVSMLKTLAAKEPERSVTFIHAARSGRYHALKEEVADIAKSHPTIRSYVCYSSPTDLDRKEGAFDKAGYLDLEWLQQRVSSPNASFYFCGPIPFMKAVYRALKDWGVDDADIHFEFFGPAGSLAEQANEAGEAVVRG